MGPAWSPDTWSWPDVIREPDKGSAAAFTRSEPAVWAAISKTPSPVDAKEHMSDLLINTFSRIGCRFPEVPV